MGPSTSGSLVPDHHHFPPVTVLAADLDVYFGYRRTSGVKHPQAAFVGVPARLLRHAVGAEHDSGSGGNLADFVYEYRALCAQVFHHELVVHDFMTNLNGRTVAFERALDDLDCPVYAGTETARIGQ